MLQVILAMIASIIFGCVYSILVIKLWLVVNQRKAKLAVKYDILVGLVWSVPIQIWGSMGNNYLIMLSEVVGSAIGTYVVTDRRTWKILLRKLRSKINKRRKRGDMIYTRHIRKEE